MLTIELKPGGRNGAKLRAFFVIRKCHRSLKASSI
uniref:Uncharacterized protein n=1 Tax=Arundo donax TaxID=35708 RepID=A0A0A8YNX1_ARUDO